MNISKYVLGGAFLLCFTACTAEDKNVVFKENFDDVANSANFSRIEFISKNIVEANGKDAIGGSGTSIILDTLDSSSDWPCSLRLPREGLLPGMFYEVTFDYKILSGNKKGGGCTNFCLMDCNVNGKSVRVITQTFGEKIGETGKVRTVGRFPNSAKNALISLTSSGGSKIMIDNLEIRAYDSPKESEWMFEPDAFLGMRFMPTHPNFMDFKADWVKMSKDKFFPFIDQFGQFKHKEWKDKIHSDEELKTRTSEEAKFNAKHPPLKNRDEFFGLVDDNHKYEATGRFRVQKVDGKWFFITPKGNLFWSHGIDCVGSFPATGITDRENYFEDISDKKYIYKNSWGKFFYERPHQVFAFARRNADKKYGTNAEEIYGKIAAERARAWGINSYGAWSQPYVLNQQEIPYAFITNSVLPSSLDSKEKLNAYWRPFPDYFDPKFESETMKSVARNAALIQSPYCIGVFVDNELPWQNKDLLTARAVLTCPAKQFSKIAFKDMLQKKYSDISKLNSAWSSKYSSWDDMLNNDSFIPKTKDGEADMIAFERKIYEHYYGVCRAAVKAVSKDVLYMGCRLAWSNKTCGIVASEICDVVSYNLYRRTVAGYKLPEGSQDKPIIIGEFHFGNQDAGVFGGGLVPCKTIADKVEAYETYLQSAIENPVIVGAHWFQWFNQCTTGRSDGENYAIGFVDICDTPSYDMAKAARKISKKLYTMRLKASKQSDSSEKTITY